MLVLALAIAILGLATVPAAAIAGSSFKKCGNSKATVESVKAKRVGTCKKARNVASHAARLFRSSSAGKTQKFNGWKCKAQMVGNYAAEAKCRRSRPHRNQVVKFLYDQVNG